MIDELSHLARSRKRRVCHILHRFLLVPVIVMCWGVDYADEHYLTDNIESHNTANQELEQYTIKSYQDSIVYRLLPAFRDTSSLNTEMLH